MKFKDREEQRRVTETMSALIMPLLPYLVDEVAERVQIGMRILFHTGIGEEEKE